MWQRFQRRCGSAHIEFYKIIMEICYDKGIKVIIYNENKTYLPMFFCLVCHEESYYEGNFKCHDCLQVL